MTNKQKKTIKHFEKTRKGDVFNFERDNGEVFVFLSKVDYGVSFVKGEIIDERGYIIFSKNFQLSIHDTLNELPDKLEKAREESLKNKRNFLTRKQDEAIEILRKNNRETVEFYNYKRDNGEVFVFIHGHACDSVWVSGKILNEEGEIVFSEEFLIMKDLEKDKKINELPDRLEQARQQTQNMKKPQILINNNERKC